MNSRETNRNICETLQAIVPQLGEAERKEYFNLHYWRYAETLKECAGWFGARVLDIGITPGHMAMVLRRFGCEVFGITDHEGQAQGRYGQDSDLTGRWAREKITVRCALVDKEPLPFPDSCFDGVLFTEVLEHLLYDPKMLVHEIHRVLKPGGGVVVSTPNVVRIENRLKALLGRNTYPRVEDFYYAADLYKRHNREYTLRELVDLFVPPFVLKEGRYIMLWEFAVPISTKGKVYDLREFAEITGQEQVSGEAWAGVSFRTVAAKSLLRLCKRLYPPFRSGLLASFVSPVRAGRE